MCDNAYCYALYVRTICCDASTAYISHSYYIRMHDYMDCIIVIYIIYVWLSNNHHRISCTARLIVLARQGSDPWSRVLHRFRTVSRRRFRVSHVYTLPYCRFSQELWDTPIGTTCASPPSCALNIEFKEPTMSLQLYKESRLFDFCSLSYSSAQIQKWHVLLQQPCWAPSFSDPKVWKFAFIWSDIGLPTTSGTRDIACFIVLFIVDKIRQRIYCSSSRAWCWR